MRTKHWGKTRVILTCLLTCILMVIMFLVGKAAITNKLVKKKATLTGTFEVAPDRFVTYQKHIIRWDLKYESFTAVHILPTKKAKFYQKDTDYLSIPWNGQDIFWVGVGAPISIRSYEDKVYMIVFDRESDFSKVRFRYYRQDHNVLSEISPKDYPKAIATRNLWLTDVKKIEALRNLNPDDITFQRSLTAKIWHQLEKGTEYYQVSNERIAPQFLNEYITKNKVIKLDRLIQQN